MTKVDEVTKGFFYFALQSLYFTFGRVTRRIHGADTEKYEILKVAGKQALHPEQGMHAGAAIAADHEDGRRRVGVEHRWILQFFVALAGKDFFDFFQLRAGLVIVFADQ